MRCYGRAGENPLAPAQGVVSPKVAADVSVSDQHSCPDEDRLVPMSEEFLWSRQVAVAVWVLLIVGALVALPWAYSYVMREWAW